MNRKWFYTILLLVGTYLYGARLETHFKSVTDKTAPSSMENIDFIYLINLDERPEKLELSLMQLASYGICPHRFSAVNGWELSSEVLNDVGVKYEPWMAGGKWATCFSEDGPYDEIIQEEGRTYFCHAMRPGSVGTVLSHLSVFQDAYDSGYETVWVMEDDIEVISNPWTLPVLINQLDQLVGKKGWGILFTDRDIKGKDGNYVPCLSHAWRPNYSPPNPQIFAQRKEITPQFMRVGARYGGHSMIIRRSGIKKLLDFFKQYKIYFPYDMDYFLPPSIRLFSLTSDVVSNLSDCLSDASHPNYKSSSS